ncbi:S-layer homology domain-containing protein [Tepidibacter thalassicus]|uniref:S-layer homology domain-containing protein n=1 Tax=Tepidibacter thalassicus DSM 15285 TaxID=1123350 RepID=A0A1M5S730_9FIRM|nr:S-layer homology domain-containing protein [Tepidibacter thalassicus]SHH33733.1 S-layer homology domain-containing protein [Tepidibacter thalassicus DSM 15285]
MRYRIYSLCFIFAFLIFINNVYAQVENKNEDINRAVNVLMGLEMVKGKEDGKFHEEQNITREEFVKMIVEFLGISDEINLVDKTVNFKDVEHSRWSAKYISLAVDMGLVKGYEGNLFKPLDNITFEQGVTILLRALGYKDEYLDGKWPLNYVSKAASEGILNGVDRKPNSLLTRGNAALMIYNAFNANYIVGFEGNYHLSKDTFLEGKLNIHRFDNMRFIEKNEKTACFESVKDKYQKNFYIKDNIDLREGMNYTLFVNRDGYILYSYCDLKNKGLYQNQIIVNSYTERPVGKIKLSGSDNFIVVGTNSNIYVNGEKINKYEYDEYLKDGAVGNFVIKDDKLVYANLVLFEYENLLVREVDVANQKLKGVLIEDGIEEEINFKDFKNGYKVYLVEGNNIKSINYSGIVKDYMISISEEIGDSKERVVYAWKSSIAGKFQKVFGGINNKDVYFTISNSQDKFYVADRLSYRYKKDRSIKTVKNNTYKCKEVLEEFYNQQVSIYKDLKGDVVYIEGNFTSNDGLYGILIRYGDELRGEIQIFTKGGSKKLYAFEDPDEYLRLKEYAEPGCILRYSVNKSGKLKSLSDNIQEDIFDQNNISVIRAGDDFGENFVVIDGRKYTVTSETAYFDYTDNNPYKVKKLTWDRLKSKKVTSDVEVVYLSDDDKLEFLAIRKNMEGIQEETLCGYVYGSYNLGDKNYVSVGTNSGEVKEYLLDDSCKYVFLDKRLILYKINNNSKLEVVNDNEFNFVVGKIDKKSGKVIRINDESYIFHQGDKIYSDLDKKLDFNDLRKGDIVALYIKDNEVMGCKLFDFGRYSRIKDGVIESVDVEDGEIRIDIKGETETFYVNGETDYIMLDGYLNMNKKNSILIEKFYDEIKGKKPNVKFIYNRETQEIYLLVVLSE